MTTYKIWDIILVSFPFTDGFSQKQRPALIIKVIPSVRLGPLYIMSMITSQIEGTHLTGDYTITAWQEMGLLHPSKIRLGKLVTLEEKIIKKKIGRLSESEKTKWLKHYRTFFEV